MSESERLVLFNLLGQEYKFYTGASEEEMEAILALVRKLVEDNKGSGGGAVPVNKVAILACLNIASRYVKLKNEFENYKGDAERRIAHINREIVQQINEDAQL